MHLCVCVCVFYSCPSLCSSLPHSACVSSVLCIFQSELEKVSVGRMCRVFVMHTEEEIRRKRGEEGWHVVESIRWSVITFEMYLV